MSYLDFLKALIALGPKLPQVMDYVQHIVEDVKAIVALVSGKEPTFGAPAMEVSLDEQEAEGAAVALMAGSGETFAAFDGTLIRGLFQFIKDNPELLNLVIALLTK